MPIFHRMIRLFQADVHGLMDQLEDRGLMLKQYLREMDEALEAKEHEYKRMIAAREQAERDLEQIGRDCERLDQDIDTAIDKNREDIARHLIRRYAPLAGKKDKLTEYLKDLNKELPLAQNVLSEQRRVRDNLRLKAREYLNQIEIRRSRSGSVVSEWNDSNSDIAEEEIELELLRRKEAKGH